MRLTRIICLGVLVCAAAVAEPAAAQVQPAGTGEPAFTNSAQNTQWFEWPATSGADAYRIQFRHYENNTEVASPTYDMPNGGTVWANWSGVRTLQHGGTYGICAQGNYSFPNDSLFFPDGPNSCSMGTMLGRRAYTTIDRSKPTAGIELAGGAASTREAKIPLRIDFADDVAGPFPANFLCFQYGGGPTGVCDSAAGYVYGYNAACSVPGSSGKSTAFVCTADYGSGASPAPDGPVWACVIAADAAIPDNPNSADQRGAAERANLSNAVCDGTVLDRVAPTAAISGPASARVGDLLSFAAQASDATSGLAAGAQWTWGDNTPGSSGTSATHTFTQAGTYEVKVAVADNAGNTGTATKVVTVAPATTGGGTTPGGSTGGGTTPGGSTGGGTTPGGTTGGGIPAGGPAFEVSAPRRLKLANARALRLAVTAGAPGRASFALVRGGRVVARGAATLTRAGTTAYRLKLAKGLKAGAYTLKATFTAASGGTRTAKRTITLAGRPAARRARASGHTGATLTRGPVALPDGRFHGTRPGRTFAVGR
jgi:hypothetical protein